jgi:phosphatidate phosphatase APP1
MDLVFHNVFSYSKTKKFDLGRYGKGESKQVMFNKPGLVKVFCEIHKTMRAYVLVLETPYFTTTDDKGYFIIEDVPDGRYTLHVWQENTEEYTTQTQINDDKFTKIEIN